MAAKRKKTKKSKPYAKARVNVRQDVWPQEREFMERPERLRYVRKILQPEGCVFCTCREAPIGFESLVLFRSKYAMVVMNKYPYNPGHLLVLPTRHCGDVTQLNKEEQTAVFRALVDSMAVLQEATHCKGMNVGLNHGSVAGAGIPEHVHWHIVPRWHGDTNFFPLIAETKALPQTVEQSYDLLKAHFAEWKTT